MAHYNSSSKETSTHLQEESDQNGTQLRARFLAIREKYGRYMRRTLNELGAASQEQTDQLRQWIDSMEMNDSSIEEREKFWSSYEEKMHSAEILYSKELKEKLEEAYRSTPRAISRSSIERWEKRFKDKNVHYKEKEGFIREKLPGYIAAWKAAAKTRETLIQDPGFAAISAESVPHLSIFRDEEKFLALHCTEPQDGLPSREGLNAMVKAALEAAKTGQNASYQHAKTMLTEAVDKKIISWTMVGVLLRNIFSEHDGTQALAIVQGGARFTLRDYLNKCTSIRDRFLRIEAKRDGKASPRNFHFVSQTIFLNWSYKQQKTYVAEAELTLESPAGERDIFSRIKHELAAGDTWEAESLIREAKQFPLTDTEKKRLQSMEDYIHAHAGSKPKPLEMESPSPEQIGEKIDEALGKIGYKSVKDRFERALKLDWGTLWALCTMNYNWKWCRLHGYSSDEQDRELRENAKDETYKHLKHGQPKSKVNNDLTTDTSVANAARWDNKTNSAQAIHVNETTSNAVLVDNYIYHNQQNRSVWYWTRIMEKNIPYGHMKYIIEEVQPVLKWGMRELNKRGYVYNRGEVEKRATGAATSAKEVPNQELITQL